MKPVRAGQFRDRVTLKRKSLAGTNAFKSRTETITDVCKLWANVAPQGSSETSNPEKTDHQVTWSVSLRYISNIKPTDYLQWGSRLLEITSIVNAGARDRLLSLSCVEVDNG